MICQEQARPAANLVEGQVLRVNHVFITGRQGQALAAKEVPARFVRWAADGKGVVVQIVNGHQVFVESENCVPPLGLRVEIAPVSQLWNSLLGSQTLEDRVANTNLLVAQSKRLIARSRL